MMLKFPVPRIKIRHGLFQIQLVRLCSSTTQVISQAMIERRLWVSLPPESHITYSQNCVVETQKDFTNQNPLEMRATLHIWMIFKLKLYYGAGFFKKLTLNNLVNSSNPSSNLRSCAVQIDQYIFHVKPEQMAIYTREKHYIKNESSRRHVPLQTFRTNPKSSAFFWYVPSHSTICLTVLNKWV